MYIYIYIYIYIYPKSINWYNTIGYTCDLYIFRSTVVERIRYRIYPIIDFLKIDSAYSFKNI